MTDRSRPADRSPAVSSALGGEPLGQAWCARRRPDLLRTTALAFGLLALGVPLSA